MFRRGEFLERINREARSRSGWRLGAAMVDERRQHRHKPGLR
jgi:hypothetical protein